MILKKIYFLFPVLAILVTLPVSGQEQLRSISVNPVFVQKQAGPAIHTPGSMSLPFLDDFSSGAARPDFTRWSDQKIYLNNSLAKDPPTYGVATLDMMDSTGQVYTHATTWSFGSDVLTSVPINLFYPQDTSVYLSFYYQPQGFGDSPEPDDSLVLEFFAPSTQRWHHAWSAPGTAVEDFRLVMVNITDSRFLQDGFKFRFRNYASLAPAYEPSLNVNADHWHLDYIYLDRNRNYADTIMTDLALVESAGPLLVNYTAMPWEHFLITGISAVNTIFPIHLNNLSVDRRAFSPALRIESVYDPTARFVKNLNADEVRAFQNIRYDAPFNYGFTTTERDSAIFTVTLDLQPAQTDRIASNDAVTSRQVFKDYYSYDDGSAEAGYGLVGEGAKNGRVAYRFVNLYPGDSLVAVQFYFNRSFADASRKYFQLALWEDDNGKPGALIHRQEGAIPEYKGINEFQTIRLDTAQAVQGTFHVGWIQTTADFLNVGFDRQWDQKEKIQYNLSGTWQTSSYSGALMVRPVFANKSRKTGLDSDPSDQQSALGIKIYPNPVTDRLYVDYPNQPGRPTLLLHDLQGRLIRNWNLTGDNRQVNLIDIPGGLYLITILDGPKILHREKLMILHD